MNESENIYTTQEIADKLKVKYRTVVRWLNEGKLKGFQFGNSSHARWRVYESDLQEFMSVEPVEKE